MDQKTQQGFPPPAQPLKAEETPAWDCVTPAEPVSVRAAARRASENPVPCEPPAASERREIGSPGLNALREFEAAASAQFEESEPVVSTESRDFETPVSSDKSAFDTVPGGGLNRESGGRPFARAYVSPKTPMPLTPGRYETVSVDVEPTVDQEGRAHRTEPSLRRASTVPPPPPHESIAPASNRRLLSRPWLIGALSVSAGIGILIPLISQNIAPNQAPSGAAVAATLPSPPSPASALPRLEKATVAVSAPEPSSAVPSPSATISAPSEEKKEAAPISSNSAEVRPKKSTTPAGVAPVKAPAPAKKKTDAAEDVWLE
jgi:hypothetical protein